MLPRLLMLTVLVTAAVTARADDLVPWRPVADLAGSATGISFSDVFLDKSKCDAFIKGPEFKKTLAAISGFIAIHGGKVGNVRCAQLTPLVKTVPGTDI